MTQPWVRTRAGSGQDQEEDCFCRCCDCMLTKRLASPPALQPPNKHRQELFPPALFWTLFQQCGQLVQPSWHHTNTQALAEGQFAEKMCWELFAGSNTIFFWKQSYVLFPHKSCFLTLQAEKFFQFFSTLSFHTFFFPYLSRGLKLTFPLKNLIYHVCKRFLYFQDHSFK